MYDNDVSIQLEFRDIEYVNMILECNSFSKAAVNLHITQPALSIYIKMLEKRLGVPVFNRLGKTITLTEAGKYLIAEGKQILLAKDNITKKINEIKYTEHGIIRVGATPTRGISLFPQMAKIYNELYPHVSVVFHEHSAQEIEQMVCDGKLDIGYFNRIGMNNKLNYTSIISDPVVVFTSPEIAKQIKTHTTTGYQYPWVNLAELKDLPFIRNYDDQNTEKITTRIFKDFKMHPPVAAKIRNQLTAINMAAHGCGLYIAPEYFLYNLSLSRQPTILSFGQTPNEYDIEFVAAVAKGAYCSNIIRDFIKHSKEIYNYKLFSRELL